MNIAIDYDCTLTADLPLFTMFTRGAKANGHEVKIVTFRHPDNKTDGIEQAAQDLGIEIIFTDHQQKQQVCEEIGWEPDIWIDDKPMHIPAPAVIVEHLLKFR